MIINCKNCNTNYVIADDSIGPDGKSVKCAKCGYKWVENLPKPQANNADIISQLPNKEPLVDNIASMVANIQTTKSDNIITTPSNVNSVKSSKILYFTPIIFTILIFLSFCIFYNDIVEEYFPDLSKIISNIGIEDYRNIEISEAKIQNDKKNEVKITYKISNHSNMDKIISKIKTDLLDKDRKLINSYKTNEKISLKSNEVRDIESKIDNLPAETKYILIRTGNLIN